MGDIFGDIFGGGFGGFGDMFGGGRRTRTGPQRGDDLQTSMEITFMEAAFGCKKQLDLWMYDNCTNCGGSGAKPGTKAETCTRCGGTGQVRVQQQTMFGTMASVHACPECSGSGKIIKEKCPKCGGSGRVKVKKTFEVDIPAGIDVGQRIRMSGKGEPGTQGGPNGDLYITFSIRPDRNFSRQGYDVLSSITISFAQAALGAEIEIPTIDGKVKYDIPAGTQSGTRFRLRGKGIPYLRSSSQRGDHYVTVIVEIPTKLNEKQKEALRKFAEEMGEVEPESDEKGKGKGFWNKKK